VVVFYVYRSVSRDEMYGRISFSVASVHALWSFLGRSSGGLPKMSDICCGIRREFQEACPALLRRVQILRISGSASCLE